MAKNKRSRLIFYGTILTALAFIAAGLYDSLNSCAANRRLVSALEPAIGSNLTAMCYEGGHMMYDDPAIRAQMTKDVAAFVAGAAKP